MVDLLHLSIKENNWLGEGKNVAFEIEVDEETLEGTFSFTIQIMIFLEIH